MCINIIVLGHIPPAEIEILRDMLEDVFSHPVNVYARIPLPEECYIENRSQYDAACLLDRVLRYPGYRVLGVVSADITIEGYNFIFGLAASPGRGAVVSVYRLRHGDNSRYLSRLKKEAMHELGHTFGLKHCRNRCVMSFSNTVFDVDTKPDIFCNTCASKIAEHLRGDIRGK